MSAHMDRLRFAELLQEFEPMEVAAAFAALEPTKRQAILLRLGASEIVADLQHPGSGLSGMLDGLFGEKR